MLGKEERGEERDSFVMTGGGDLEPWGSLTLTLKTSVSTGLGSVQTSFLHCDKYINLYMNIH